MRVSGDQWRSHSQVVNADFSVSENRCLSFEENSLLINVKTLKSFGKRYLKCQAWVHVLMASRVLGKQEITRVPRSSV